MKLKSFCPAKKTINKMKGHPSEWEKIFANETTDKGLISRIYKHLMQLKLKDFCTANETINKMKRQPMEWEKIFANYVSDKG